MDWNALFALLVKNLPFVAICLGFLYLILTRVIKSGADFSAGPVHITPAQQPNIANSILIEEMLRHISHDHYAEYYANKWLDVPKRQEKRILDFCNEIHDITVAWFVEILSKQEGISEGDAMVHKATVKYEVLMSLALYSIIQPQIQEEVRRNGFPDPSKSKKTKQQFRDKVSLILKLTLNDSVSLITKKWNITELPRDIVVANITAKKGEIFNMLLILFEETREIKAGGELDREQMRENYKVKISNLLNGKQVEDAD